MKVIQAIKLASEWVEVHGSRMDGFCGAHLMGGINNMPADATFPTYTDLDVAIVLRNKEEQEKLEILYKGVMLEVGFYSINDYVSPEAILSSMELASHLAAKSIIADPTGLLEKMHRIVASEYSRRKWAMARFENQQKNIPYLLERWSESASTHQRFLLLLYTIEAIAGLVAVAHLRPPTFRKCLLIMRQILEQHDRAALHEKALRIVGCDQMSRSQVEAYAKECGSAFEQSVEAKRTPFVYGFKLQAHLRPYFVDASEAMIEQGYHREAMWWILAGIYISNVAIENDGSQETKKTFRANFNHMLADLGLVTNEDWSRRLQQAQDLSEEVYKIAREILEHNPQVID